MQDQVTQLVERIAASEIRHTKEIKALQAEVMTLKSTAKLALVSCPIDITTFIV
jgi:hypothetical protein